MVSVFQIWVNYNFVGSNPQVGEATRHQTIATDFIVQFAFYSSNYKDRQLNTIEAASDITLLVLHITSLTRGGEFLVLGAKPRSMREPVKNVLADFAR